MGNANKIINGNGNQRTYGGDLYYPQDIGGMERTGHYVQFFINKQESSKIEFAGGSFSGTVGRTSDVARDSGSNLSVKRAPTQRLAASIQLYMPNQISLQHGAKYAEEEINAVATNLMSGLDGGFSGMTEIVKDAAANTLERAKQVALAGGSAAAADIARGKVTNNRTEMKFEGIDRRSFSFDFKMIPKGEKESNNIKNIVNLFRFHAMPEMGSFNGRTMIVPSTFDIKYMHKSGENDFLNKISTCVLESIDIKFGGDRTQFFKNNAPMATEISLKFKELEIITKERIAEGF
jgi:hypothetical protein